MGDLQLLKGRKGGNWDGKENQLQERTEPGDKLRTGDLDMMLVLVRAATLEEEVTSGCPDGKGGR